jgi:hypothetical protein
MKTKERQRKRKQLKEISEGSKTREKWLVSG